MPKFHFDYNVHLSPIAYNDISLIQIGRLYCDPSYIVPMHIHGNWFELTAITDGEGVIVTNGHSSAVKRGDICLSFPADSHEILSSEKSPLKCDFFSFHITNARYEKELEKISKFYSPSERIFTDERISNLLGNAIVEFNKKHDFTEDLCYSIFKQIIVYTILNFKPTESYVPVRNATPTESLCCQIMSYIDSHVYTLKSLEELSELFEYNYSYLSALFKNTTGEKLASYYHKKRLETAMLLLTEKRLKVSEVAEALNYSSPYSFSRAFKEIYGISPKQYTKRNSPTMLPENGQD